MQGISAMISLHNYVAERNAIFTEKKHADTTTEGAKIDRLADPQKERETLFCLLGAKYSEEVAADL